MTRGDNFGTFDRSRNSASISCYDSVASASSHYLRARKTLFGNQLALTIAPWSPMKRGSSECAHYGQKLSLAKIGGKEREDEERETEGGKHLILTFATELPSRPAPRHAHLTPSQYLRRVSTQDHDYTRVNPQTLCKLSARGSIETVYVRQSVPSFGPQDIYPVHALQLRKGPTEEDGYKLVQAISCSSKIAPLRVSSKWTGRFDSAFKINKVAGRLAGALLLEHINGERLVILLGSTTEFGVGFEAASLFDIDCFDLEKFKKSFNPRALGTNIVLENHQVRVSAETWIIEGVKYYIVDIVVEAIFQHSTNPIDVIDVVDLIAETSSRGFKKFRFPFKFFRKIVCSGSPS